MTIGSTSHSSTNQATHRFEDVSSRPRLDITDDSTTVTTKSANATHRTSAGRSTTKKTFHHDAESGEDSKTISQASPNVFEMEHAAVTTALARTAAKFDPHTPKAVVAESARLRRIKATRSTPNPAPRRRRNWRSSQSIIVPSSNLQHPNLAWSAVDE